MKTKDAYLFPVIAGCFLVGLYLLFKFINKDYVNLLLNVYFLIFGFFALVATLHILMEVAYSSFANINLLPRFKFTVPLIKTQVDATILDAIGTAAGIALIGWYVLTKHWVASNLLGLAFSIQGIAFLALPNYKTGAILLGGLFFYDIFFVFATDVMVTVAKSFDAPIKLLIPKDIWASTYSFSMLGLGDIVLPGVFLAFLLRYDAFRAKRKVNFASPYFTTGFIAYVLGLFLTIYIMHTFQAAQPALLYLVPACLGSSALAAVFLKDVKGILKYTEDEDEEPKDASAKKEETNGAASADSKSKEAQFIQKKLKKAN